MSKMASVAASACNASLRRWVLSSSSLLSQSACNAGAVTCYASAGYVFGTVTAGTAVPAAIAACNATQGACMAACAVANTR